MKTRGGKALPTLAHLLLMTLLALSFCNLLYAQNQIVDRAMRKKRVDFDGVSVIDRDVSAYGYRIPAYYWIKDNSPKNAVVLVSLNYGRHASLFHERLNFVRKASVFLCPKYTSTSVPH